MLPFLFSINLPAQENISIGTWRTHYSYNQVNKVLTVGNNVYAAGQNGLFIIDQEDNSITTITKKDGLQGGAISAMQYDPASELILIAYASGNLDVIEGQSIINIDLITNSQILGSKNINHISIFQSFAYLSTDYGVLKFDLTKKEVQETYRELGIDNDNMPQALKVNMSAVVNDSLFISSAQGVLAANLVENINLLDYQNWRRFTEEDGLPIENVSIIGKRNNQLIAGIDQEGLFSYNQGQWTNTNQLTEGIFTTFYKNDESIIVSNNVAYTIGDGLLVELINIDLPVSITDVTTTTNGTLWLGTASHGVISNKGAGAFKSYLPSGPQSNTIFRLKYVNGKIYGLSGGFSSNVTPLNQNLGFYIFDQGRWKNFNSTNSQNNILEFKDIVDVASFGGNTYFASIGYGLLRINGNGEQIIFDETNSPLINTNPPNRNVKVPAIVATHDRLWVLNYGQNQIYSINQQGEWESFTIPASQAAFTEDLIAFRDQLWLIIGQSGNRGIVVFDPASDNVRYLNNANGNGSLASTNVNTLVLDFDSFIWAGTDRGVSVFSNPFSVFDGAVNAVEPIFENRQLLIEEEVNDIEVDGGDRKWMGTNSGVWLFDDQADNQIQFFNMNNSPLPSNEILDVAINDKTGEVFFATPNGIISWRGTSTSSEIMQGDIKIFPNPVRADYKGVVGISGLTTDAIVKITDVSGKLIWQTQANGGTATWKVRDYNGSRAATGIYLVFSASEDGEETIVGKIAVVN